MRTCSGLDVRPTSDRLRETLFNILAPRIEAARFLDLCAGSGAIGIEALSRGADSVTFVERSPRACLTVETNLQSLGVACDDGEAARVIKADAGAAIRRLTEQGDKFDIVFFDPPYASTIYNQVMIQLGAGRILSRDAIVVVEHRIKTPPPGSCGSLTVCRQVKQGDSGLTMFSHS